MQKQLERRELTQESIDFTYDKSPLLKRIYSSRHISKELQLNRDLSALQSYASLKSIDAAVDRFIIALNQGQTIVIIGDFDADGATSTALAVRALRSFGAEIVDFLVPNRFEFGYGLTPKIVDVAKEKQPDLIVTVDNGISSHDGVDHANSLGIDVIITDHHLPAENGLPNAVAVVNPNQDGDEFPSKSLAGVGVIFYVMLALRAKLKKENWFELNGIECPNMAEHLDLVALGTVSDVVTLDQNNRILVHQGLRRIRAGLGRPGINALLHVAKRDPARAVASDLGFAIGPRLNAAGRLDDMAFGVACLLSETIPAAKAKAEQLDNLNRDRKGIESEMQKQAYEYVDNMIKGKELPLGVCLFDETWHQGIIGLVSSRLKERLYRPVIAFADVGKGEYKGSARSIVGFHIRDALEHIAKNNPGMLTKFGGHSMAAGLSLPAENYPEFKKQFEELVSKNLTNDDCCAKVLTDGELEPEYFTLPTAEMLRDAGPWGQGFPEPVFDGTFELVDQKIVGQKHLKLILKLIGSDSYCDGIAFNVDLSRWPSNEEKTIKITYKLDVNSFHGRRKLQLLITNIF
jgi:single-stranded-DNA-specific exonuclease